MNTAEFWYLIALLDASGGADTDRVIAPVVVELSRRGVDEIHAFDKKLSELLYSLDTRRFASEMGEKSFVDGKPFDTEYFLHARCCVIANGEDFYRQVKGSPKSFPRNQIFPALLDIAPRAFSRCTGKPEPEYQSTITHTRPSFAHRSAWRNANLPLIYVQNKINRGVSILFCLLAATSAIAWCVMLMTIYDRFHGRAKDEDLYVVGTFSLIGAFVVKLQFATINRRPVFLGQTQQWWKFMLCAAMATGVGLMAVISAF